MMSRTVYDVCVVGAGLFGSAAARHATILGKDKRILLIGPKEPEVRSTTDIFAGHYDVGRLIVPAPDDAMWGLVVQRATRRFRDIEKGSGVSFFDKCGFLKIGLDGDESVIASREVAEKIKHEIQDLNTVESRKKFPYIHFRAGEAGLYSEKEAGSINPRKFLQAQLTLAKKNGCTVVDDVVNSISPPTRDGGVYEIFTGRGHSYLARSVLLATGAFTCCRDLLPFGDKIPDIRNLKKTIILVEIAEEEYQAKLTAMPTMLVYREDPNDKKYKSYWAYIMKPLRYPDGKLYMKLGGWGDRKAPEAKTPQELSDWYRIRGDPVIAKELMTIWRDVFPGLKPINVVMDGCVTSHTPKNTTPFIDMVQPGLGVAIGGCAKGAMSSDEIGRIAARMILNMSWDEDYQRQDFKIKYKAKPTDVKTKSKL